jgi:divalent metal cation (Fe/Co/Zn/Cd) transporter
MGTSFAEQAIVIGLILAGTALWPCHVRRTRAHAIMDELDSRIKKADARVKRVFIESQNLCEPAERAREPARSSLDLGPI